MDSNIKNNMESNLSRADKEKFNNMISKIRENILEFKEYFFIGDNKKVFVVRSIRRSRFSIFNNNIKWIIKRRYSKTGN